MRKGNKNVTGGGNSIPDMYKKISYRNSRQQCAHFRPCL